MSWDGGLEEREREREEERELWPVHPLHWTKCSTSILRLTGEETLNGRVGYKCGLGWDGRWGGSERGRGKKMFGPSTHFIGQKAALHGHVSKSIVLKHFCNLERFEG